MAAPQPTTAKKKLNVEQLSPEAQEAVRTRKLTGNWDLKKLVRVLAELAQFDEITALALKANTKKLIWCSVGIFLFFVAGIFLSEFSGFLFLIPLIPVTLLILLIKQRNGLKRQDMIDDFRVCLRPALRDLAADLDPEKKIKVEMNLSGAAPEKQTSKKELPPGRYQKLTETVFQDPWCEVRLPLIDGSTAIIEFENCYRKLERRYRSSRGKTKWKTKWRKECCAAATLLPAAPVAWQEQALQSRISRDWEKLKFFEKEGVRGARLEHFWAFKAASDCPVDAPPAREVVGLLLRLHGAMGVSGGAAK